MLTDHHKEAIVRTWRLVVPIKETAADLFYQRLFELKPEYEQLFTGDMASQKRKLIAMLAFIVRSLNWKDADWKVSVDEDEDLFLVVLALGRRHIELYHVPDEAYDTVGQALLWTLDYGLGKAFTDEVREAWTMVYSLLAATMKMGRAAKDLGKPIEVEPKRTAGIAQ